MLKTHRKYILSGYIADDMRPLKEDEPEKFQSHFSGLVKEDI
jgi:large subunit ribosomal protein L5e